MKSVKQTKTRFLRVSTKQVKLNNQFNKLPVEEKTTEKGRKLLQQLIEVNAAMKELYWVLDLYSDTKKKEQKPKAKKKK